MASPSEKLKLCFVLAALCGFTTGAEAANFAPHRAVYDLKSTRISKDERFSDVDGRFAYELTGSTCSGWSVSYRFVMRYAYDTGPFVYDSQVSSWESADGNELRINAKEFNDGKLKDETRREAMRRDGKISGKVTATETKTFELPDETLFPMQHQVEVLLAAARGENIHTRTYYDGSENENPFRVVTIIGKDKAAAATADVSDAERKFAKAVEGKKAFPMTFSYYKMGEGEAAQPTFQNSYRLFENGLVQSMTMNYQSFAIDAKLFSFEQLPEEKCP